MPAKKSFDAELIKLIEDEIANDPFELDGYKWAVVIGQDGLAEHLSVSTKTLSRRLADPPFKRRVKRIDGEARTLLRIRTAGEPDETADELKRKKANQDRKAMAFEWKKKTGEWPTYDQATRLWGFALDLSAFPLVEPVHVFKFVLTDWDTVASAIKKAQIATPGGKVNFYDFPSIGPMRRFWKAVLHAYVSKLMDDGKIPPDLPNGKVSPAQLNAFAAILQATEFEPVAYEPPYTDQHIADLMAKKAAKKASPAWNGVPA